VEGEERIRREPDERWRDFREVSNTDFEERGRGEEEGRRLCREGENFRNLNLVDFNDEFTIDIIFREKGRIWTEVNRDRGMEEIGVVLRQSKKFILICVTMLRMSQNVIIFKRLYRRINLSSYNIIQRTIISSQYSQPSTSMTLVNNINHNIIITRYLSTSNIERLSNLRNVGIFAHVDAGKTTITENMLEYSGTVSKVGTVDEGDTVTDYLVMEKERGITIQSACISLEWGAGGGTR